MADRSTVPLPDSRIEALSPAKRALLESLTRRRAEADSREQDTPVGGVLRLREGATGSGEPIVLVHPIGGGVFCYAELSRLIPGDREVLGLAADRFLRGEAPRSVADLADHYLGLLRARGVNRPAALAGWSFGGLVAHEMARIAVTCDTGAETEGGLIPVVLIDSAPWPPEIDVLTQATTLVMFVEDLLGSGGVTVDHVPVPRETWQLPVPDALDAATRQLAAQGLDIGLPFGDLLERFTVFANAVGAMRLHRPGPYPGPVTMLHAADSQVDPKFWTALAPGTTTTIVPVPGDHFSVLRRPTVYRVANALGHATGLTVSL